MINKSSPIADYMAQIMRKKFLTGAMVALKPQKRGLGEHALYS
jgi:hypothetical protein